MNNFAKWTDEKLIVNKNARGSAGLTGIGAGIGAIREVGILRNKINKKYAEECAEADAQGKPRPPKPDTSTKTLLAILKGALKGAVVGKAVSFIPGVGRGLRDTVASLGAGANKLLTGNSQAGNVVNIRTNKQEGNWKMSPAKTFSFMNTFLPKEGEVMNELTLSYLTDQDFSEINLANLDIGEVTEIDLYKMFFSLADAASRSFSKQELNEYFSRKKIVQDNSAVTDADVKMMGLSKAAMPVIGAIAGGGMQAVKARKRALAKWQEECAIADAQGKPRPPKPSILTLAGDVAKGAGVGAGIGWVGSKIAPGTNEALSKRLAKFGLTSAKNQDEAAYLAKYNAQTIAEQQGELPAWKKFLKDKTGVDLTRNKIKYRKEAFFSYNDYRAALARKGQQTTLTEEQFYSIPEEGYEILIRNMQPMNYSAAEIAGIGLGVTAGAGINALRYAGLGALISAIKSGLSYKQYKKLCEEKGEEPATLSEYMLQKDKILKAAKVGGLVGLGVTALKTPGAIKKYYQEKQRKS